MGTTSVKNAVQYEVIPTSTVSTTSGSQLMNKTFTDSTYATVQSAASFTGTVAGSQQFICSYAALVVNGSFISQMNNLTISISGTQASLLTLDLDTAVMTETTISLTAAAMTSFSGANLKYIVAPFTLVAATMTTFSFPVLTVVLGAFSLTAAALTTLSLPQFTTCAGTFLISATTLTSLTLSVLATCLGTLTFTAAALTTLSLPLFASTTGGIVISSVGMTTLSLPSLVSVATACTFTTVNMTNVTIGSTLKLFASNFNMTGAKLTQASVDNILVRLAALDGTNGTTAYSSRTVNLSGGTSSTPSATGLTAKATLQARSCTVTTN